MQYDNEVLIFIMRYIFSLVTLVTLLFSFWVSAPFFDFPLNGMSQKDISDMYHSAVTPASFTFSIWSVIYLSWCVLAIMMIVIPKRQWLRQKAAIPLTIAIALSGLWLIPWAYNWIGVSMIIMLLILGLLMYTFFLSRRSSPLGRTTVELFLGWIHIATIAQFSVWLMAIGVLDGTEEYFAIGILAFALIVTIFYQVRYRTYSISLVYLWALVGVWVEQVAFPNERSAILLYAGVTIITMIITLLKRRK